MKVVISPKAGKKKNPPKVGKKKNHDGSKGNGSLSEVFLT
jgi:hypothetical protein